MSEPTHAELARAVLRLVEQQASLVGADGRGLRDPEYVELQRLFLMVRGWTFPVEHHDYDGAVRGAARVMASSLSVQRNNYLGTVSVDAGVRAITATGDEDGPKFGIPLEV